MPAKSTSYLIVSLDNALFGSVSVHFARTFTDDSYTTIEHWLIDEHYDLNSVAAAIHKEVLRELRKSVTRAK